MWADFFGKTNDDPCLLASIWKDRLVAIQVTGRLPADKYVFNGITLGATAESVTTSNSANRCAVGPGQLAAEH